jgi:hypothetical protein
LELGLTPVAVLLNTLQDLNRMGLWNADLKNELVAANGSVQDLDIPEVMKALYKTVSGVLWVPGWGAHIPAAAAPMGFCRQTR